MLISEHHTADCGQSSGTKWLAGHAEKPVLSRFSAGDAGDACFGTGERWVTHGVFSSRVRDDIKIRPYNFLAAAKRSICTLYDVLALRKQRAYE